MASGPMADKKYNLTFIAAGDRIDWFISPRFAETGFGEGFFPLAGPFDQRVRDFELLVRKWLPQAPAIERLAFGAILVSPQDSIRNAISALRPLLPRVELSLDELDFIYGVNRPRVVKVAGTELKINRLTKWTAVTLQAFRLQATQGLGVPELPPTARQSTMNVARIEIDINTAIDMRQPLPQGEKSIPLFSTLVSFAREIAAKGDHQ